MPNKLRRLFGSITHHSTRADKRAKLRGGDEPPEVKVTIPDDEDDSGVKKQKHSTEWTAGVPSPPGQPVVELSTNRISETDENSITDEINISWEVPQDDGGYPISGYRVEMLDIQSGCWAEITFIEGYEPKCTLSNILYGIMYRFRIVATNDAGSSEPGEPSEPVVVDVPGVQIAPYYVQPLSDAIALEYEMVEFRVSALGTPRPVIQWFRDELEILPNDRMEVRTEEEGSVLTLRECRMSDSCSLKCIATNSLGKAVSTCQFTVEATPRFELPEQYQDGLVYHKDEVIRLKIPYSAKPAAKIVWFFDEEPISSNGQDIHIETTETQTCLRIDRANRWHCGEFRVYAENDNGEDACAVLVTVTSHPSPPGRPEIIDISDTKCTIKWDPPNDDGGAQVKQYVLEYFRDTWNVWLKAKATRSCQETIEDLIAGSRYIFRVKAENDYGISEASEESTPFDVNGIAASTSIERLSHDPEFLSQSPEIENFQMPTECESWDQGKKDILDRFLNVEHMKQLRVPSTESDGLPSIASFEEGEMIDTRHQISITDSEDDEIFNRNLSMDSESLDESVRNEKERSSASSPSISVSNQDVEVEKREEEFEMALNEMIQEASIPASNVVEEELFHPRPTTRSKKSPSVQSTSDSIVSVIEHPGQMSSGMANIMPTPAISVTNHEAPETAGRVHQMDSLSLDMINHDELLVEGEEQQPHQHQYQQFQHEIQQQHKQNRLQQKQQPELPLQEQQQQFQQQNPTPSPPARKSMSPDSSPVRPSRKVSRGAEPQVVVGTDRYEEIIRSSRSSSVNGSQNDVRAKRNVVNNDNSSFNASELSNKLRTAKRESIGSPLVVGIGMSNNSNNNSNQNHYFKNSSATASTENAKTRPSFALSKRSLSRERPQPFQATRQDNTTYNNSNNNNNNNSLSSELATKTLMDPKKKKTFQVRPIEISIDPTKKTNSELLTEGDETEEGSAFRVTIPQYLPQWFMITYAYSFVLILILLISNVNPDGKLFIHLTAFWSVILYFLLDEEMNNAEDPLERVVENFVSR